jgi:hypothetical protein
VNIFQSIEDIQSDQRKDGRTGTHENRTRKIKAYYPFVVVVAAAAAAASS